MKKLFRTLKSLWKDESAQGATEYILLLVVVVAIALLFRGQIMDMVRGKLTEISGAVRGFSTNGE